MHRLQWCLRTDAALLISNQYAFDISSLRIKFVFSKHFVVNAMDRDCKNFRDIYSLVRPEELDLEVYLRGRVLNINTL